MPRAHNRKDGLREPNGQLSRKHREQLDRAFSAYDTEERETMDVGLSARERMFGLPRVAEAPGFDEQGRRNVMAVSRDQMAGTVVGRLYLTGEISFAQHEAAVHWRDDCEAYARTLPLPAQPTAIDPDRVHGRSNREENIDRSRKAKETHDEAKKAVQAAEMEVSGGIGSRFSLLGALWHIVQRDQEFHYMVPDLRVALNALVRHYKTDKILRDKAA